MSDKCTLFLCAYIYASYISPTVHANEQCRSEYASVQCLLPTTRYVLARELDNKHSFYYPSNKPDILSSYQFFIPHLTIMICHQIRTP